MTETLERRVSDIEDLIADIPQMINLRLDSLAAVQAEGSARVGLLDKQMAMVLRDLRGGVTRQLVEQDKRLAAQDQRLAAIEQKLDVLLDRLPKA